MTELARNTNTADTSMGSHKAFSWTTTASCFGVGSRLRRESCPVVARPHEESVQTSNNTAPRSDSIRGNRRPRTLIRRTICGFSSVCRPGRYRAIGQWRATSSWHCRDSCRQAQAVPGSRRPLRRTIHRAVPAPSGPHARPANSPELKSETRAPQTGQESGCWPRSDTAHDPVPVALPDETQIVIDLEPEPRLRETWKYVPRCNAVSAAIERVPLTMALIRFGGTSRSRANWLMLIPSGLIESLRVESLPDESDRVALLVSSSSPDA